MKSCKPYEKTKQKKHQNNKSIAEKLKTKSLMVFASFFHVICNNSNFAKLLAQASFTELTLFCLIENAKLSRKVQENSSVWNLLSWTNGFMLDATIIFSCWNHKKHHMLGFFCLSQHDVSSYLLSRLNNVQGRRK